ncbi:MAG TPA: hypothetical protein VET87_01195 [Rubrivivax sp.]|nr:hypothetical protein [Rubrivivax sp.]
MAVTGLLPGPAAADWDDDDRHDADRGPSIQIGPRPFFLVNDRVDSPLKQQLLACTDRKSFQRTKFSIGQRARHLPIEGRQTSDRPDPIPSHSSQGS